MNGKGEFFRKCLKSSDAQQAILAVADLAT